MIILPGPIPDPHLGGLSTRFTNVRILLMQALKNYNSISFVMFKSWVWVYLNNTLISRVFFTNFHNMNIILISRVFFTVPTWSRGPCPFFTTQFNLWYGFLFTDPKNRKFSMYGKKMVYKCQFGYDIYISHCFSWYLFWM